MTPSSSSESYTRFIYGYWLVLLLAFLKWVLHLYASGSYGFHGSELLYLSASEHPAFGYLEFPPLIAWLGWVETTFIGKSVLAIRTLPAFAGICMVLLTGSMARALGGGRLGMGLAAAGVLGALAYFRDHTLFQPAVFDQFFWTAAFFFLIRYLRLKDRTYLWLTGLTLGIGLLNQYTLLIWLLAVGCGVWLDGKGKAFGRKETAVSALLVGLLFLPNLIWQAVHGFPVWEQGAQFWASSPGLAGRLDFLKVQFWEMNPFSLPLWLAGLWALFFYPLLRPYRFLGIAFLVAFLLTWLLNAQPHFIFGAYPVLFAAGGVALEFWVRGRWRILTWMGGGLILMGALWWAPHYAPILSIEKYLSYAGLTQDPEEGATPLPAHFAGMFGWEEQVALLADLYQGLSEEERAVTIVWAGNPAEAGAIQIIGDRYGLPDPVCYRGSFWQWGPGALPGEVALSIGNPAEVVGLFYRDTLLVTRLEHPYAGASEQGVPVYLCRGPERSLQQQWPQLREQVFK